MAIGNEIFVDHEMVYNGLDGLKKMGAWDGNIAPVAYDGNNYLGYLGTVRDRHEGIQMSKVLNRKIDFGIALNMDAQVQPTFVDRGLGVWGVLDKGCFMRGEE